MTTTIEPSTYGTPFWGEDAPSINLSNHNAAVMLEHVGITLDVCGGMSGREFLALVEVAQAKAPTGALSLAYGRDAEYVRGVLSEVRAVAEWATERGLEVQWA